MKHSTKAMARKKVVGGIAVGIAVTLTAAGGGIFWHYQHLADTPTAELPDNPTKFPETGDTVTVTPGTQHGIKLTSKAFTTERGTTAQLITATVLPEDTVNKSVTWEIGFVNPQASWAADKKAEDYVTMSPNSSTATVECNKAFGEQIAITVTAQANTKATAECTLDYIKRVTSISFSGKRDNVPYAGTLLDFTDRPNEVVTHSIKYEPMYSVYTIDDTFTAEATLETTQTLRDNLMEYAKTVDETFEDTYYFTAGFNANGTELVIGDFYSLLNELIGINKHSTGGQINFGDATERTDVAEWNKFVRLLKGFAASKEYNTEFMKLSVTYTGENSSYSDSLSYQLGTITADILPESITTDKNHIIF